MKRREYWGGEDKRNEPEGSNWLTKKIGKKASGKKRAGSDIGGTERPNMGGERKEGM